MEIDITCDMAPIQKAVLEAVRALEALRAIYELNTSTKDSPDVRFTIYGSKLPSVRSRVLAFLRDNPTTADSLVALLVEQTPDRDSRKIYASVYRALSTLIQQGLVEVRPKLLNGRKVYGFADQPGYDD